MLERLEKLIDDGLRQIEEIEQESLLAQMRQPEGRLHGEVIGVTMVACVVLTVLDFYGGSANWRWFADVAGWVDGDWKSVLQSFFNDARYGRLRQLAFWSFGTFVGYLLVPALYVKFVMSRTLEETGFSTEGVLEHAWIYVLLYLFVLPVVYAVSGTSAFQATYPFYDQAGRSAYDFLVWESLYALQFLSLEFFFRGFLVHGLARRFGFYSIFVSVIPYCMIHFGKPFPEAIGSIVAGIVLGAFSLATGSIWLGVLIHVSVAVSMDVFALI